MTIEPCCTLSTDQASSSFSARDITNNPILSIFSPIFRYYATAILLVCISAFLPTIYQGFLIGLRSLPSCDLSWSFLLALELF
jgi:hypothetical protein